MKPKYQAMIHVLTHAAVKVYFSRPVGMDILADIKKTFEVYEGFEVTMMTHIEGSPLRVWPSPTYDTLEVAKEIEKILRSHGFEDIGIKIDEVGKSSMKSTLLD